jgi:hypothetical protein
MEVGLVSHKDNFTYFQNMPEGHSNELRISLFRNRCTYLPCSSELQGLLLLVGGQRLVELSCRKLRVSSLGPLRDTRVHAAAVGGVEGTDDEFLASAEVSFFWLP